MVSVCARPSTSGRLTAYGIIRASYAPLERNAKLSFRQGTGYPFYFFFCAALFSLLFLFPFKPDYIGRRSS